MPELGHASFILFSPLMIYFEEEDDDDQRNLLLHY